MVRTGSLESTKYEKAQVQVCVRYERVHVHVFGDSKKITSAGQKQDKREYEHELLMMLLLSEGSKNYHDAKHDRQVGFLL